ncbi:MAG: helix-turn-helix domain-containing protein, partial [Actinomycetota bacterium]
MARKNTSGLARDIEIVELLADTAEALGVSTIARRLNRDLTQISRALATLAEAGIVRRDPVSRGYL